MEEWPDNLTGAITLVLLVAAGLTAVASVFMLWLYKRAVLRSMRRASHAHAMPNPLTPQRSPSTHDSPLALRVTDGIALDGRRTSLSRERRSDYRIS